ncbi:hypothetical protein K504DRAFT_451555 [Pleomassaria siparia CBS 279.74]|uniref:Uncharacterized protein n=1 Tax=Pleomassaria siparia CBS 279.74 TaxID=1314801 RepID=A0A6G1JSX6_9PLEO|nr:hypothetical protein K504DRAFT_451555 [Pleomassaria siparia CBS 279.74]
MSLLCSFRPFRNTILGLYCWVHIIKIYILAFTSASPKAIIIYTNIVKLLLRTAFKLIRTLNNIANAPRNSLVTGLFSIECTYVTYIITLLHPINNKQEFTTLKAALVTLAPLLSATLSKLRLTAVKTMRNKMHPNVAALKKPKIITNDDNSNFNISNSNKEVKEKESVIRDSNSLEDEGHNALDTDKIETLAALEAKIPKYMLLRKDAAAALKLCIRLAADLGRIGLDFYRSYSRVITNRPATYTEIQEY